MHLYILRHGIAVEPGTAAYAHDSDRPLTPEGKRKLRKIARALKTMDISFDWILSSPFLRARQTAEIIADVLDSRRRLELTDSLIPSGDPAQLIKHLNQSTPPSDQGGRRHAEARPPEDVLLVGHEPYLSQLVSLLISGGTQAAILLKKGGLCKLSAESLAPARCAQLDWLLTPRQLIDLA